MTYNIGEILGKYIELRDRKADLAKHHDEEMRRFTEPMGNIENYLMHTMNTMGVSQLKEEGVGTAFKATSTSVQLKEPDVFKEFVFAPAVAAIITFLEGMGYYPSDDNNAKLSDIIRDMTRWDVVELRAGKKGIQEHLENTDQPVPGVVINSVATISIRRA